MAYFRGAIVCISNRELHDGDLLGAFKSRVHTLNYDPTDAQMGALMLDIAGRGPCGVPPGEAEVVARHVIGETLRRGCRFDLRAFVDKAIPDYLQWKDGETESHWKDLVSASIEQHLVACAHAEPPGTRAGRLEGEREIVREIIRAHPTRAEQLQAWVSCTGMSERAFYRRLAKVE